MVVRRVEVDQTHHAGRIRSGKGGELVAGDRVTHQSNPTKPERIEHRAEIGYPAGQVVARGRLARRAIAPACDGYDVVIAGELRGEVIESMGHVLQPGQEYEGRAGATPVEHFQLHAVCNWNVDLTMG